MLIIDNMIIEAIIKAIKQSGKTRYQIAQDLKKEGISESFLCKMLKRKNLHTKKADILLEYFGLELKQVKRAKK